MKFIIIILLSIFAITCNEQKLLDREDWLWGLKIDTFTQGQGIEKLDIIWVIDNSGSMEDNQIDCSHIGNEPQLCSI